MPAEGGAGGDFFLVAPGPRDATVVVVGDVAGKGLQAAKRAAYVRMAFAAAAPFQDDPCKLLELANTNLIERAGVSDIFVTAACFVIQPREDKISWALAGHPPPLLLADGQRARRDPAVVPARDRRRHRLRVGRGRPRSRAAGFVAFTDGLIEARRARRRPVRASSAPSELVAALRDREPDRRRARAARARSSATPAGR